MATKQKINKDNLNSPVINLIQGADGVFAAPGDKKKGKKVKVKTTRISVDSIRPAKSSEDIKIGKHLVQTNKILLDIQKQLTADYTGRIKEHNKELADRKKALSKQKFLEKEDVIESAKGIGRFVGNTAKKLMSPFGDKKKNIFQKMFELLGILFKGALITTAFSWLSDPRNRQMLMNGIQGVFGAIGDVINWIKAQPWEQIWQTIKGVGEFIINALKFVKDAVSPIFNQGIQKGSQEENTMNVLEDQYGGNREAMIQDLNRQRENLNPLQKLQGVGAEIDEQVHLLETGKIKNYGTMRSWDLGLPFEWTITGPDAGFRWKERLMGGSFSSGKTYLVGERGPELARFHGHGTLERAQRTAQILTPPDRGNSFSVVPLPDEIITQPVENKMMTQAPADRLLPVSSVNSSNRYMEYVPEVMGIR